MHAKKTVAHPGNALNFSFDGNYKFGWNTYGFHQELSFISNSICGNQKAGTVWDSFSKLSFDNDGTLEFYCMENSALLHTEYNKTCAKATRPKAFGIGQLCGPILLLRIFFGWIGCFDPYAAHSARLNWAVQVLLQVPPSFAMFDCHGSLGAPLC